MLLGGTGDASLDAVAVRRESLEAEVRRDTGVDLGELDEIHAGISPTLRFGTLGVGSYCVESGANGTAFEYYYALGQVAPSTLVNGVVTQGSCA